MKPRRLRLSDRPSGRGHGAQARIHVPDDQPAGIIPGLERGTRREGQVAPPERRRIGLLPDDLADVPLFVEKEGHEFDPPPAELGRDLPGDPGQDPEAREAFRARRQGRHGDVDGHAGERPFVDGQIEQVDPLFEIGVFAERLGIEVPGLGPDLAAPAFDLDLDVVEQPVPALVDGIAEDIVASRHGPDLVEVLVVEGDVRIVFPAGDVREALERVEAGRLGVLEDVRRPPAPLP